MSEWPRIYSGDERRWTIYYTSVRHNGAIGPATGWIEVVPASLLDQARRGKDEDLTRELYDALQAGAEDVFEFGDPQTRWAVREALARYEREVGA